MLESALKEQLKGIFAGLEANFAFDISVSSSHENRAELLELLGDVADCSDHITYSVNEGNGLKFTLLKNGNATGITFRGIPNGHEFTSLLLAILNLDGKGKNFPDEAVCNRVKALKGPIHLVTYVSLTCTNCPDVVQALNAMTTLNPAITHEMVDGALYQDEVDALKIQGVPSVFADGKHHTQCQPESQHSRAAVADKGQGHANYRQNAADHAHIDKNIGEENHADGASQQAGKNRLRMGGNPQNAPNHEQINTQQQQVAQ